MIFEELQLDLGNFSASQLDPLNATQRSIARSRVIPWNAWTQGQLESYYSGSLGCWPSHDLPHHSTIEWSHSFLPWISKTPRASSTLWNAPRAARIVSHQSPLQRPSTYSGSRRSKTALSQENWRSASSHPSFGRTMSSPQRFFRFGSWGSLRQWARSYYPSQCQWSFVPSRILDPRESGFSNYWQRSSTESKQWNQLSSRCRSTCPWRGYPFFCIHWLIGLLSISMLQWCLPFVVNFNPIAHRAQEATDEPELSIRWAYQEQRPCRFRPCWKPT